MFAADKQTPEAQSGQIMAMQLSLASPLEQKFIQTFRRMLDRALNSETKIRFVERHLDGNLTISISKQEPNQADKTLEMANLVLNAMKESYGIGASATSEEGSQSERNKYVLFDFEQSFAVAESFSINEYASMHYAYNATLALAQSSPNKIATEKLIDLFCQFANKATLKGEWRTAAVCMDYAESLLTRALQKCSDRNVEMLCDCIYQVGQTFCNASLPERAMNIALNALEPTQYAELSERYLISYREMLVDLHQQWKVESELVWSNHAPIFEFGDSLLKKQAA